MGQYWQFINIDKRETTGHLGKLGEFFFSSESERLLFLLAIPVVASDANPSRNARIPGAWAGDRIICLGDYASEWPAGCVAASDFDNLPADEEDDDRNHRGRDGILPPDSLYYNSTSVKALQSVSDDAYPENCVWVLRNLTKKLYVRSNGIPALGEADFFGYTATEGLSGSPGLGHVLLSRIAWSQDPSSSMSVPENLTEGEWAGDRFDVRLFSDVQESMMEDDWKDVSRENARRLHRIWVEYWGDHSDFQEEPQDQA